MNQLRTGQFISSLRKEKGLTQSQLAEKLGITDRAVSKWETGKSLPDAGIMIELCEILGISVNELLTGERLEMTNYNEMAEKNLLELKKQKEQTDKRLLRIEIVVGLLASVVFFVLIFIASFAKMEDWLRITLIITGFIPFVVMIPFAIRIEQTAGYYECQKCGNRYVPKYSSVLFAMHVNRTRYMKCPDCGKYSWQKKVISKDKE